MLFRGFNLSAILKINNYVDENKSLIWKLTSLTGMVLYGTFKVPLWYLKGMIPFSGNINNQWQLKNVLFC